MADTKSDGVQYVKVNPVNTPIQPTPPHHGPQERLPRGKSWRAPLIILASLIVGLGMAIAHDSMNVRLNGHPVEKIGVSQAWISRISTGLAFLVKLAFATSVGAAFVQHQWLRFHRQSFKIVDVDNVTSVLGNPLSFLSPALWFRHPILFLIAVVSWILPFAAVVTPGSLSVRPIHTTINTTLQVPQPQFDSPNSIQYGSIDGGGLDVVSTSATLYRLAYATASTAQPVSLLSTYQNETYHLQFDGPALKCSMANDSLRGDITKLFDSGFTGNLVLFASWVAGDEEVLNNVTSGARLGFETLDRQSSDGARIFVMSGAGSYTAPTKLANVTECLLHNATYDIDFAFQYPQQTRNVSISRWLSPVPGFRPGGTGSLNYAQVSFSAMMHAYGKLLVGYNSKSHYSSVGTPIYTSYDIMNIDWSRSEAVEAGLEQLFQNFTLSLLSSSDLIKDSTQADHIPVQVETWPNTYNYDRRDLLLPYGLAFLFAGICAVAGFYSFFVNHDSYQNLFSTFLRATNDADLRAAIGSSDPGADPLPKYLMQVQLRMAKPDVNQLGESVLCRA